MRRISVSFLWSVLEYLSYPLLLLISTPFFLKHLGAADFGLWMLLNAILGFNIIVNTGTGNTVIKKVSECIGAEDTRKIRYVIQAALAVTIVWAAIFVLLIALVFGVGKQFFFPKIEDAALLGWTGVFAAGILVIDQFDYVFSSALKGANQFGTAARTEMLSRIVQVLTCIVAIYFGGGLLSVFTSLLVVYVLRMGLKLFLCIRLLDYAPRDFRVMDMGDFLVLSKWGWLQGLGAILFGSVDRLLVGSLFGASTLSYYSLAAMLPPQIHAVLAAGMSVLFPMISSNKSQLSISSFNKMVATTILLSGLAAGVLLFGSETIFNLWLPNNHLPAFFVQVFNLLVLAYFLLSWNIIPHYVMLGRGRIKFVALINLTAGLVTSLSAVLLAESMGITGVAISRVLYAIIACYVFAQVYKELNMKPTGLLKPT